MWLQQHPRTPPAPTPPPPHPSISAPHPHTHPPVAASHQLRVLSSKNRSLRMVSRWYQSANTSRPACVQRGWGDRDRDGEGISQNRCTIAVSSDARSAQPPRPSESRPGRTAQRSAAQSAQPSSAQLSLTQAAPLDVGRQLGHLLAMPLVLRVDDQQGGVARGVEAGGRRGEHLEEVALRPAA